MVSTFSFIHGLSWQLKLQYLCQKLVDIYFRIPTKRNSCANDWNLLLCQSILAKAEIQMKAHPSRGVETDAITPTSVYGLLRKEFDRFQEWPTRSCAIIAKRGKRLIVSQGGKNAFLHERLGPCKRKSVHGKYDILQKNKSFSPPSLTWYWLRVTIIIAQVNFVEINVSGSTSSWKGLPRGLLHVEVLYLMVKLLYWLNYKKFASSTWRWILFIIHV